MKFTIVGGGLAGAALAYHLKKFDCDVTVYDRKDKGQATKASAGIICPWVSQRRNKKWYRLVSKSAAFYPSFIKTLEKDSQMDTGYKQNGAICLFKENAFEKATKRIQKKADEDINVGQVTALSKNELKDLHPFLTTTYPGLFVEGGGQVRGQKLLLALKTAFLKLGGQWLETEYPADQEHDGYTIYTTGAWGIEQNFLPKISHQRAEIMHFNIKDKSKETPVVMALGPTYIVHLEDNRYVIGTTHIDTDSFLTEPTEESYQYLKEELYKYFQEDEVEIVKMDVGLKPYTRDFLPFIGFVDQHTFVINGMGSTGLTASPFVGSEVAKLLLGKETNLDFNDYNYINSET